MYFYSAKCNTCSCIYPDAVLHQRKWCDKCYVHNVRGRSPVPTSSSSSSSSSSMSSYMGTSRQQSSRHVKGKLIRSVADAYGVSKPVLSDDVNELVETAQVGLVVGSSLTVNPFKKWVGCCAVPLVINLESLGSNKTWKRALEYRTAWDQIKSDDAMQMIMEMLKYDDTENGSNHWDVTLPVSGQKRTYESMKGDGGSGGGGGDSSSSSSSSSSSMSESGSGSGWIGPLVTGTKLFREEGEGVVDL